MKARLIEANNQIQLLLCTGNISVLAPQEARSFILSFEDQRYYRGDGIWDFEDVTMEDYRGDTIAYVDDEMRLTIVNAKTFRKLIEETESTYLTVPQYAAKHGKQNAIVRRMCQNGRIEGVILKGGTYLIPEDSPYPADARVGKRV